MIAKNSATPVFPFATPRAYQWLIDRGLAGFEPFSALQPWYLLTGDQAFSVSERWPRSDTGDEVIVAFARRQDCDDLACFECGPSDEPRVLVVHGWTPDGYEVVARYETLWAWLKSVVNDIAEWVALSDK